MPTEEAKDVEVAEVVEETAEEETDVKAEGGGDGDDDAKKEETPVATEVAEAAAESMEVEKKDDEDKKDDKMDTDEKEEGKTEKKDDSKKEEGKEEKKEEDDDPRSAIWEPAEPDVLSGRGASVNAHGGNKKFRGLCFARKPEFEAGNHAAKRRIATEIVAATYNNGEARFLKKKADKGPWYEMTREQAILKACQVMRDYKRPDRLAIREMMAQNGQARKRSRQTESTPIIELPVPTGPLEPIIENPFGVHDHDILCGRGAFVNGHIGNQRLRTLAQERKAAFDSGNYTEKRTLAGEIVQIIKALDPPGRFLKRAAATPAKAEKKEDESWVLPPKGTDGEWEELNDEKAIHKACQVMRDIDRPDRKDREERRAKKKQKMLEAKTGKLASAATGGDSEAKEGEGSTDEVKKEDEAKKEELSTSAEKAAVEEAVAATEEALDKALASAESKTKEAIKEAEGESVEV